MAVSLKEYNSFFRYGFWSITKKQSAPKNPSNLSFFSGKFYHQHVSFRHASEAGKIWQQCDSCLLLLPTADAVKEHKESVHAPKPQQQPQRQCMSCTQSFDTPDGFRRHFRRAHHEEALLHWFKCLKCKDLFEV
jgi:hypothetical protein